MNGTQARAGRPASAGSAIEGMLLSFLANRYLWLALGLAAYIIIHLTLLQYRPRPWFETEDLLAHSMFIIELALLATVLLCGLGAGQALSRACGCPSISTRGRPLRAMSGSTEALNRDRSSPLGTYAAGHPKFERSQAISHRASVK